MGGKGLTGPICPSLFIHLFCLMPDDLTRRGKTSEWERVKRVKQLSTVVDGGQTLSQLNCTILS